MVAQLCSRKTQAVAAAVNILSLLGAIISVPPCDLPSGYNLAAPGAKVVTDLSRIQQMDPPP
jgi:hypothetical protein